MAKQNPQPQAPNYNALLTELRQRVANISFTQGWDHEPKMPPTGTTGLVNHVLKLRRPDTSSAPHVCMFLANGTHATVTEPEIAAIYEYLERSYSAIPELISAVEAQAKHIQQQDAKLKLLQTQLDECRGNTPAKPM